MSYINTLGQNIDCRPHLLSKTDWQIDCQRDAIVGLISIYPTFSFTNNGYKVYYVMHKIEFNTYYLYLKRLHTFAHK